MIMGDRANICIKTEPGTVPVYLYTHHGGESLPRVLQKAMDSEQGRKRWQDPAYLARIIFCKMIGGDVDGETGFGIASTICDNEHPILVVDCHKQRLGLALEKTPTQPYLDWTFAEFCKLSVSDLDKAWTTT
jgi:hypothetical protein